MPSSTDGRPDIPAEVYEAAALAYDRAVNDALRNPPGYVLGDTARMRLVEMAHFRASIESAYAAGVAAGRAQAAADIRAMAADERAIFNRFGEPADAIADALEDAATITEGGGAR